MARGFLGGLLIGGAVSVLGAGVLSVIAFPPPQSAVDAAPGAVSENAPDIAPVGNVSGEEPLVPALKDAQIAQALEGEDMGSAPPTGEAARLDVADDARSLPDVAQDSSFERENAASESDVPGNDVPQPAASENDALATSLRETAELEAPTPDDRQVSLAAISAPTQPRGLTVAPQSGAVSVDRARNDPLQANVPPRPALPAPAARETGADVAAAPVRPAVPTLTLADPAQAPAVPDFQVSQTGDILAAADAPQAPQAPAAPLDAARDPSLAAPLAVPVVPESEVPNVVDTAAQDAAAPGVPSDAVIAAEQGAPDAGGAQRDTEIAAVQQPRRPASSILTPNSGSRLPTIGAPTAPTEVGAEADAPAGQNATPETGTGDDVPALDRFAADFDAEDTRPRLGIVLMDQGQELGDGPVGLAALGSFPYALSFAVDASLPNAAARMAAYRADGFEVLALVDLPESMTAADTDVALSAALDVLTETVAVLEGPGSGLQGSRDMSDQVAAVLRESGHGIVWQPNGLDTAQKLAARSGVASQTLFRDFDSAGQTPVVIRRFLDQAAFKAGQQGAVIMVGRLRADTISALLLWGLQDRASRVAVAPISAVLRAAQSE